MRPSPMIIVGGLILVGGLYFGFMLVFRREVLDSEPGQDVFSGIERRSDPDPQDAGV